MSDQPSNQLVEIEYRKNKQMHIIHVNSMIRAAVDEYVEIINKEILQRETDLLLSVHDYSKLGGAISPYFLGRMREFSNVNRRNKTIGRVALVTNMDMFRLLFNPIVKMLSKFSDDLAIRFFSDLDEAVQWVAEYEEPQS